MAEYLIEGAVSPEAKKELLEIQKIAEKIGVSLKGVTLKGVSTETDLALQKKLTAETELLTKKIDNYNQAVERKKKLTMEQKVSEQALNAESKLRAILLSNETTALQKLDAQIKLNVIDAQKYVAAGDTQNKKYLELIANTKRLSTQYDIMAKASGANMVKTQSMYGATFQLTQVMRELPNFAIDARLGFMALSNNLPMLIDSFKLLSQQIDVNTGKAYGFSGALKQFGKSLLSMNTIMIVASTLLILFGDKVVDLISGIGSSDRALKNFIKTISESSGAFGTAAKKMDELNAILNAAQKGFISQKDAIDEYNKAFGDTNGNVSTFEELQKRLIDQTPAYIQAVTMQAYANSLLEQSISIASEAEALRRDKTVKWYQRVWGFLKVFASNESVFGGGMLNPQVMQKMIDATKDESILQGRQDAANKKDQERNRLLEEYYKAYSEFAKFAKDNNLDFWGGKDKKQGGEKITKEFIVDLKAYAKERESIIKKISETEQDVEKTTAEGVLNSYDSRRNALKKLYEYKESLLQIDLETEQANENEKYKNDVKAIVDRLKTYTENTKISDKRKAELKQSADLAIEKLTINHNNRLLELEDKYKSDSNQLVIETAKSNLAINKEAYEEDAALLKENLDNKLRIIEENYNKQVASMNVMSAGEILASGLGIKVGGNNDITELLLKQETNKQKLQSDIDYTKSLMNLKTTSSEEMKKLSVTLASQEMALMNQQNIDKQEYDRLIAQKEQDVKVEIAKQTVELLSLIWDSYYEMYFDKLDEERDRIKRIEDEKLKTIQDKEDAGVLTKKQAEEEKARTTEYYASVQEDIDRQQKEAEREKFLFEQATAIATIWINAAVASAGAQNLAVFGAFTPLYAALAAVQTGIVLAQTIPYFATGGIMDHDGAAVMGDAGKHELAVMPDGRFFISDNKPTLYNLEKDTEIFPDINRLDLTRVLGLKQESTSNNKTEDSRLMRELINTVKAQKSGNFYGMPLINQLDRRNFNYMRGTSLKN